MSLVQRYAALEAEATLRAAKAAQLDTARERVRALTRVFQMCGAQACAFHQPEIAARKLVRAAIAIYRYEREVFGA
ncbi:hypothetical protein AB0L74_10215 [Streptomyces sp. NPDC052020]|uniref:hypothetical protein n=1 Tax=Streptomyces sp. NPDC052020 TaxID=3155677 RepID=UPI00341AE254